MDVIGIDRVMFAGRDIEAMRDRFADLLDIEFGPPVEWHTGMPLYFADHPRIEILGPAEMDDEIARYIDEHGQGLYGVAFRVADIEAALSELADRGVEPLFEDEIENVHEAAFHPKEFAGVYVVLAEHHHPIGDPRF
ncbi:VOC family protein [Halorarius halobius]|uniref:VOC family protein n=1 Tax=Halorarius halobius TaxID=2962671 RepID=UPI0020CD3F8A|nr:VOC family protein [Halorarius halobius]